METIWKFRTRNFTVALMCEDEQDPDLSWADEETLANLESGLWVNYVFAVKVFDSEYNEIGADYLGNSIYENSRYFRDHIGARGQWGSYFRDMVSRAIEEARQTWNARPVVKLREAA